ncbi:MAG: hypothetical protein B7Z61_03200 [Acidobacteria bacterium 37-71-11]|nr:MAG: hypothetical protein B7Z61_03200 [Acidobacteria bacterium 37-71-11]
MAAALFREPTTPIPAKGRRRAATAHAPSASASPVATTTCVRSGPSQASSTVGSEAATHSTVAASGSGSGRAGAASVTR